MKVANFTDTYIPHTNGVATSLYTMHHAKKDWEDAIFGPVDNPEVINVKGIPFPLYPEYKMAFNTGWLKRKARDYDIIHNHTPYAMFYYGAKVAKKLGKPLVGTFHTDPAAVFGAIMTTDSLLGIPSTQITWNYLIKLYNRCDRVIAVSSWLEREIKARGVKKPIDVIPNGIDTKKFTPDIDSTQFKEKFDIPDDKPVVLFMGRLQYKKDPETFVRAALESESDATFVVVGQGELEFRLKKISKDNPNIKFNGVLPAEMVPQAYAASDLFVFPSEMETQGVVLLEACASGLPCISTDVGIAGDILDPEYIVGQKDHGAIAEHIDNLISDIHLRKRLAKDGRKLVEKEYSIDANVRKLSYLYEEVSGENRS